jgi:hypothetical protein
MKKTRKHRSHRKHRKNRTIRHSHTNELVIPSSTPLQVRKISNKINADLIKDSFALTKGRFALTSKGSYSPTINKQLVTLQSIERSDLQNCNTEEAFQLKDPLQVGINGKCFYYYKPEAKRFLLHNLAANKHIDYKKIIPPIQSQSNCWFNAMFVTFFVSDKGRKFFHFLRQLMIEGKQKDGSAIPENLRDAFALLNFGVDACLTGNEFAYTLNTNSIIHLLYKGIPRSYKSKYPYIVNIDESGNPLLYYISIINYLQNNSIQLLFIRDANSNWRDAVELAIKKMTHLPHIIVFEIYDENASKFNKKPISFSLKDAKYEIDSAVLRDTTKQHFCTTITCEGKEIGYDGASFHRLVPLSWKHKMNNNMEWEFEGTKDYDGTPLKWSFTKSYQLLIYYRVK